MANLDRKTTIQVHNAIPLLLIGMMFFFVTGAIAGLAEDNKTRIHNAYTRIELLELKNNAQTEEISILKTQLIEATKSARTVVTPVPQFRVVTPTPQAR